MPGNVLNAKLALYVVPAKMMINYYFVTIAIVGTTCIAWFLQLRRHQRDLGFAAFALKRFTRNNSELLIFVNFFHQKLVKCLNFSLCFEF